MSALKLSQVSTLSPAYDFKARLSFSAATPEALAPAARPKAVRVKALHAPAQQTPDTFAADLSHQMTDLRGYAVWLCGSQNLADDLIQDTLLKAWMARDRFEPGTNLRAWCMTILRNVFFSYKRRSWRSLPLSEQMISDLVSESAESGDRLDLLAVRNAMALLPLDQREALLLIAVGGLSYIDAAKVCECAVGTLKSRVSRARLRLATLISENKAGFSSDPELGACETLNDLVAQSTRVTMERRPENVPG